MFRPCTAARLWSTVRAQGVVQRSRERNGASEREIRFEAMSIPSTEVKDV